MSVIMHVPSACHKCLEQFTISYSRFPNLEIICTFNTYVNTTCWLSRLLHWFYLVHISDSKLFQTFMTRLGKSRQTFFGTGIWYQKKPVRDLHDTRSRNRRSPSWISGGRWHHAEVRPQKYGKAVGFLFLRALDLGGQIPLPICRQTS